MLSSSRGQGIFEDWLASRSWTSNCVLEDSTSCAVVINNIVTEVFNFNIYSYYICRQVAVLWLCILRKQFTYCVIVSTICSTVDDFDRFDLFFILRLAICHVVKFFFRCHDILYLLYFIPVSALFVFLFFYLIAT